MQKILLGSGPLTWDGAERRSDRYGTIFFHPTSANEAKPLDEISFSKEIVEKHVGERGKLIAEVINTRKSEHLGDWFRGIYPSTPEVGDEIELGKGTLFYERQHGKYDAVGLYPDNQRKTDWLIPQSLYRAHEQTVKLFFIPESTS